MDNAVFLLLFSDILVLDIVHVGKSSEEYPENEDTWNTNTQLV